jgi:hypothetical protein
MMGSSAAGLIESQNDIGNRRFFGMTKNQRYFGIFSFFGFLFLSGLIWQLCFSFRKGWKSTRGLLDVRRVYDECDVVVIVLVVIVVFLNTHFFEGEAAKK